MGFICVTNIAMYIILKSVSEEYNQLSLKICCIGIPSKYIE